MRCPHCRTDIVGPDVPDEIPSGILPCPLCGKDINSSLEEDPGCGVIAAVWVLCGANSLFLALLLAAVTDWGGGGLFGAAFLAFCLFMGLAMGINKGSTTIPLLIIIGAVLIGLGLWVKEGPYFESTNRSTGTSSEGSKGK